MKQHYFEKIDESVYRTVLANGLTVIFVPKNEYHRTYGVLTTHYGSVHQHIRHKETGEYRKIPAGAAHFLEHKMFEGEQGEDAFGLFMKQGAMANAFTTHLGTSYLFSASYQIEKNIETLLDFVQIPTFTVEGIEKEKGIILQELHMYEDNPSNELQQMLQYALYPKHAAGVDILGTEASIQAMTYDDLRVCFDTFYHPSNMSLIVVGKLDKERLLEVIEANQAKKQFSEPVYELINEEVTGSVLPPLTVEREIYQPLVECGWRLEREVPQGKELLRHRIVGDLFFELLLGPTSTAYAAWYKEEFIDSTFYYSFVADATMHYLIMAVSSPKFEELAPIWQAHLANWQESVDLNEEHLALVLKGRLGDVLQMFNTLEYIAYELIDSVFNEYELFDIMDILQSVTLEDLIQFGREYFMDYQTTYRIMVPK